MAAAAPAYFEGQYDLWEDVPDGPFKDVLRTIVEESPTSLALDSLIKGENDLAILIKTLRDKSPHTVTTISMRFCDLR